MNGEGSSNDQAQGGPGAEASPARPAEPLHFGAEGGLPAVLPRLSEYRIVQVEKAASSFGREVDAFWNATPKLAALRDEVELVSHEQGVPVRDIHENMKPDGDLAHLREKFDEAVAEHPDFARQKKAMDKALDSYVRQYGRAQEELINPEQHAAPQYDNYVQRLTQAHEGIELHAAALPAFANSKGGLEHSHLERLTTAVSEVDHKLAQVATDFEVMVRGKPVDDVYSP